MLLVCGVRAVSAGNYTHTASYFGFRIRLADQAARYVGALDDAATVCAW